MVNSSGLLELFAPLAGAFEPELVQPANPSVSVETAASFANRCQPLLRTFMAGFSFPQLPSVVPELSYRMPTPGDRLAERNGNCARRRENPTGWRRRACRHTR